MNHALEPTKCSICPKQSRTPPRRTDRMRHGPRWLRQHMRLRHPKEYEAEYGNQDVRTKLLRLKNRIARRK